MAPSEFGKIFFIILNRGGVGVGDKIDNVDVDLVPLL
jgi:hypothetical protein